MALIHTPQAIGTIHREFEADVLAQLVKHGAKMHGCPVWKVESKLDGGIAIWFKGPRPPLESWEGALRFSFPLLHDKKWLGDVNAVSETALQILASIANDTSPVIHRAQG